MLPKHTSGVCGIISEGQEVGNLNRNRDSRDDLDLFLDEEMQDERFKAAYEDAAARSSILRQLLKRRAVRHISQSAVAGLMGTTQSAVSDLEAGSTDPRLSTLQRYARAIGCRLQVCVKDYPNAWQTGPADEAMDVRPVNVLSGRGKSEWSTARNSTSIQVTAINSQTSCEDASLA
jgi:transcriptional regulator with XRE-family HTH domain